MQGLASALVARQEKRGKSRHLSPSACLFYPAASCIRRAMRCSANGFPRNNTRSSLADALSDFRQFANDFRDICNAGG